jgi:hypothetical protein
MMKPASSSPGGIPGETSAGGMPLLGLVSLSRSPCAMGEEHLPEERGGTRGGGIDRRTKLNSWRKGGRR